MDDVDYDDLIYALKEIVDKYGEEVAPYAVSLCQKLSEAYLRLLQAKGNCDDEDNELGRVIRNKSLLLIDDEADNASLNNMGHKGREYATKINKEISVFLVAAEYIE
jgi:hypothetical protein